MSMVTKPNNIEIIIQDFLIVELTAIGTIGSIPQILSF